MDADFSIELAADDPVLDFPWTDPEGKLTYVDLRRHPELIEKVEETKQAPEIAEFLKKINSTRSIVESAKCDVWATTELNPEEDVFSASHKFASYVDILFSAHPERFSLAAHEKFVRQLTELLARAPHIRASAEICVRRCFYAENETVKEGFYATLYLSGFGEDEKSARQNWAIATQLVAAATLQISSGTS